MSGSGKSDGEKITYGLKEQEDICTFLFIVEPVIDYLHRRRGINEFVICFGIIIIIELLR